MRELIKNGAYSFVNGTRSITVTDGRSFTAHDIRLIYNETQDVVICSSGSKAGMSVVGNVITYSSLLPALATGDEVTIEIDFPQVTQTAPPISIPVLFSSTQAAFTLSVRGILTNIGDATNPKIRLGGAGNWIDITLPYNVNIGDQLMITCAEGAGCTEVLTVLQTSLSLNTINPGTLGTKTIANVNNTLYYSPTLAKAVAQGLAIHTEDNELLSGDGNLFTNTANSPISDAITRPSVEVNGYLYTFSIERNSFIRINLTTKVVTTIGNIGTNGTQARLIYVNGYIYAFGNDTGTSYYITAISVDTLTITNIVSGAAVHGCCTDGTNLFLQRGTSVTKITGLTYTSLSGFTAGTFLSYYNGHVYACYGANVYKIDAVAATPSIVATITTNRNGTVLGNYTNGQYLYTIYSDGYVTKIDLSTFVSPSNTVYTGTSFSFPCFVKYTKLGVDYLAIISNVASVFATVNLSTMAVATYNLTSTYNRVNVDDVNGRLLFFRTSNVTSLQLYTAEIVNIP